MLPTTLKNYFLAQATTAAYEQAAEELSKLHLLNDGQKQALARRLAQAICTASGEPSRKILPLIERDLLSAKTAIHLNQLKLRPTESRVTQAKAIPAGRHFYHSGDLGDIVYALPALRELAPCSLHLGPDSNTLQVNGNRPRNPIGREAFNFLQPLLAVQPYLTNTDYAELCHQSWTNCNTFRQRFTSKGDDLNLAIEQAKHLGVTPTAVRDAWLTAPAGGPSSPAVLFARSARRQNHNFPWAQAVERYKHDAAFIGLPEEHDQFCQQFGSLPRLPVNSALELAQVLQQCELLLTNTTFTHAVAEGLKKKVIVELVPRILHAYFDRPGATYVTGQDVDWPNLQRGPKFYHVVSRYKTTDPEAARRTQFANLSWEELYARGVVPVHVWSTDRTSLELGDARAVPYWKDLLRAGLNHSSLDDDIIIYSNDDTVILPEILPPLKDHVRKHGCTTTFRCTYRGPMGSLDQIRRLPKRNDLGRDLFAFTRRWLQEHLRQFPDYLIGTTDWDYFLAIYMRLAQRLEVSMETIGQSWPSTELPVGYVWHEAHLPWWKQKNNRYDAPAQRHNIRLTKAFFAAWNLSHMR